MDGNGELQVTGLSKCGDLLLSVLDPQSEVIGTTTLSFDQGAVIDATTGDDGRGHITLREDTDVIALSFSLLADGSLQCSLRLAGSE